MIKKIYRILKVGILRWFPIPVFHYLELSYLW